MSLQHTLNLGLPYNQAGDKNWAAALITQITTLDALDVIGPLAVSLTENPSTTLHVAVAAGTFYNAKGVAVTYAGASSVTLTASNTNYLYLTDAGVLTHNTTGFPAATNIVPLATVVAGASTITSITLARVPFHSAGASLDTLYVPLAGGTMTGFLTLSADPTSNLHAATKHYVDSSIAAGTGTVTSVALTAPAIFAVAGSPITTSGTFAVTLATQTANTAFLGPSSGSAAAPTFRRIVPADLPTTSLEIDSHFGTIATEADGATITFDCAAADFHQPAALGGNRTLAVVNDQVGQQFTIALTQDGTGSRTVTWWSGIRWPGGTTPTLTTTASKIDVFTFKKIGSGSYLGFPAGLNL